MANLPPSVNKAGAEEASWSDAAAKRLAALIKAYGNVSRLAEASDVSRPSIRKYADGEQPRLSTLSRLAEALGVSAEEILTGHPPADTPQRMSAMERAVQVPLLDLSVSAGDGTLAPDDVRAVGAIPFPKSMLERFGAVKGLAIALVKGDSMEPDLRDGDWLMFDRDRRELVDGLHVVRIDDGLFIKRLRVEGRSVAVVSANPAYPERRVDRSDDGALEIVGRAVWSGKALL